ncbi:PQQ-binding-like beta-propeller repeat protein [Streptomyces sp. GKU 257-1]|nr:PQQ-binding-like beta-propeller repeat protein [Streptomyces sp. GKU 257-1]
MRRPGSTPTSPSKQAISPPSPTRPHSSPRTRTSCGHTGWRSRAARSRGRPRSRTSTGNDRISSAHTISSKDAVYVSDSDYGASRIHARTGKVVWRTEARLDLEAAKSEATPRTAVSPDGRILLSSSQVEVDAYETRSGSLLWRFMDLQSGPGDPLRRRHVTAGDEYVLVASERSAYSLPLH